MFKFCDQSRAVRLVVAYMPTKALCTCEVKPRPRFEMAGILLNESQKIPIIH